MQQTTTKKRIWINKAKLFRFISITLAVTNLITILLLVNATAYKRQSASLNITTPVASQELQGNSNTSTIGTPAITITGTLVGTDGLPLENLDITIHVAEEDVIALAKMIWGEARGVKGFTTASGRYVSNTEQIAACVWTVLNRVDADYSDSIIEVITAKNQFTGYRKSNPVNPAFTALARDCIIRWQLEKILAAEGISLDTGRVLPKPDEENKWCWFNSDGNGHNAFKGKYGSSTIYDWSLSTPYEEDIIIDFDNNLD